MSGLQTSPAPMNGSAQVTPKTIDGPVRAACDQVQERWKQPGLLFDGESWFVDGCSRLIVGAELQNAHPPRLVIEAAPERMEYLYQEMAAHDLDQLAERLCSELGIEVQVVDPWRDPVYASCNEDE
jgi:hypothetical protein